MASKTPPATRSRSPARYNFPTWKLSPMKLDSPSSPVKKKTKKMKTPPRSPFDYQSNVKYSSAQIQTPVKPYYEILEEMQERSPERYNQFLKSIQEDYKKSLVLKRKNARRTLFVEKRPYRRSETSRVLPTETESLEETQVLNKPIQSSSSK